MLTRHLHIFILIWIQTPQVFSKLFFLLFNNIPNNFQLPNFLPASLLTFNLSWISNLISWPYLFHVLISGWSFSTGHSNFVVLFNLAIILEFTSRDWVGGPGNTFRKTLTWHNLFLYFLVAMKQHNDLPSASAVAYLLTPSSWRFVINMYLTWRWCKPSVI